jgi:hypothetical protein
MTSKDTHSPVLVRMENALKADLLRTAKGHGRTLTGEIVLRLRESLTPTPGHQGQPGIAPGAPYPTNHTATAHTTNEKGPATVLTDHDRAMLDVFRRLPAEKQLALLSLFK